MEELKTETEKLEAEKAMWKQRAEAEVEKEYARKQLEAVQMQLAAVQMQLAAVQQQLAENTRMLRLEKEKQLEKQRRPRRNSREATESSHTTPFQGRSIRSGQPQLGVRRISQSSSSVRTGHQEAHEEVCDAGFSLLVPEHQSSLRWSSLLWHLWEAPQSTSRQGSQFTWASENDIAELVKLLLSVSCVFLSTCTRRWDFSN